MSDREPRPEFGPGGYLPDRAARRARKIVLRAPLGLQWVVATIVAGIAVLVAGVVFLGTSGEPPGAPFVALGAVADMPAAGTLDVAGRTVLVVGAGGRVRAFVPDGEVPAYCDASRRLEAADGRVWALTGRGLGGADSLAEHPVTVVDGNVYVDPTRTVPGPAPDPAAVEPGCAAG